MSSIRFLAFPLACGLALVVLAGCMTDRRSEVPANATLFTSGDGQLSFTPQTDGTIWILSSADNSIVYSGAVPASHAVVVDPAAHLITVNGRIVTDKGVASGVMHKLYFLAGPLTGGVASPGSGSTGY
ncbi:MAG: hypothetical protein M3O30_02670 [Planctomycetota bacterium]|nr:hypothetical protein [Planctomycetota bacterium]